MAITGTPICAGLVWRTSRIAWRARDRRRLRARCAVAASSRRGLLGRAGGRGRRAGERSCNRDVTGVPAGRFAGLPGAVWPLW